VYKNALSAAAAGIAVIFVLYAAGWMTVSDGGSVLPITIILFLFSLFCCVSVAMQDPVIHGTGYSFGMVFAATSIGAGLGSGLNILLVAIALGALFPLVMAVTYWVRRRRDRGSRVYHVHFR
jgi:hypothetical protein